MVHERNLNPSVLRVFFGAELEEPVKDTFKCQSCGGEVDEQALAEARWYPFSEALPRDCPACVQENLLRILLAKRDAALHEAVQTVWPLDAEAGSGRHSYKFLLDGDCWLDDPANARKIPDGLGGFNSVVCVT